MKFLSVLLLVSLANPVFAAEQDKKAQSLKSAENTLKPINGAIKKAVDASTAGLDKYQKLGAYVGAGSAVVTATGAALEKQGSKMRTKMITREEAIYAQEAFKIRVSVITDPRMTLRLGLMDNEILPLQEELRAATKAAEQAQRSVNSWSNSNSVQYKDAKDTAARALEKENTLKLKIKDWKGKKASLLKEAYRLNLVREISVNDELVRNIRYMDEYVVDQLNRTKGIYVLPHSNAESVKVVANKSPNKIPNKTLKTAGKNIKRLGLGGVVAGVTAVAFASDANLQDATNVIVESIQDARVSALDATKGAK